MNMPKISWIRVLFAGGAAVASILAGIYLGDALRLSEKPSEYIGVTFSILAASLFAVISIIGDPSMVLPGNWRVGYESAKRIQGQIQIFNYLFVWYLLTLGLLVASEVIEAEYIESLYWIFNVFAGFSVFGFLISLSVPFMLSRIQKDRLEEEVRFRAERKGVK